MKQLTTNEHLSEQNSNSPISMQSDSNSDPVSHWHTFFYSKKQKMFSTKITIFQLIITISSLFYIVISTGTETKDHFNKLDPDSFVQKIKLLSFREMASLISSGHKNDPNFIDVRVYLDYVYEFQRYSGLESRKCIESQILNSIKQEEFCEVRDFESFFQFIEIGRGAGFIDQSRNFSVSTTKIDIANSITESNMKGITVKLHIADIDGIDKLGELQNLRDPFQLVIDSIYYLHDDQSMSRISENIKRLKNLNRLKVIFHSNGSITDEGVKNFSDSLKQLRGLKDLTVQINSQEITDLAANQLADALVTLKQLNRLHIGLFSMQITDDGLEHLINGIRQHKLIHLNIGLLTQEITDRGLETMADMLKDMKQLESLFIYLNFNQITDDGLIKLTESLKDLKQLSLISLNLDNNQITEDGVQALRDTLVEMGSLKKLLVSFHENPISSEVNKNFANTLLEKLKNLQQLVINGDHLID